MLKNMFMLKDTESKINFILISGKARSGKDTIAKYLIEQYGYTRWAFADKLKECIYKYSDWDGEKDEKGRKLLQSVGQAFREYDKDNWIKVLAKDIVEYIQDYHFLSYFNIVISDVRFINEIETFKYLMLEAFDENNIKFRTIRIDRPIENDNAEWHKDISEIDLDNYNNFDYIISNDSDIDSLYRKIDKIMKED